jgi:plastocyanin
MDSIDSRHLTNHDGFLQLFTEDDVFQYHVTAAPRGLTPQHEPAFELEVKPGGSKKGAGTQHRVAVAWDPVNGHYVADPPRLEIAQNDFVMWHCDRMVGTPPYRVSGKGRKGDFDSTALGPNAVFTHFFLQPGSYDYQVNGRGAFGVEVLDHRALPSNDYLKRAAVAPVVQIKKGKPDPARIEVVAGQTVVWAVENERDVVIAAKPPRRTKPRSGQK